MLAKVYIGLYKNFINRWISKIVPNRQISCDYLEVVLVREHVFVILGKQKPGELSKNLSLWPQKSESLA